MEVILDASGATLTLLQHLGTRIEMRLRCIMGRATNLRSRLSEHAQGERHRLNTLQKTSHDLMKRIHTTDYNQLRGCAPAFASEYLHKLGAAQREIIVQQGRCAHIEQKLEKANRMVARCQLGEEKLDERRSLDAADAVLRGQYADADLDNCQSPVVTHTQPAVEPPLTIVQIPTGMSGEPPQLQRSSAATANVAPPAPPIPPAIEATLPDGTAVSVALVGVNSVTVRELSPSVLLPRWLPQAETKIKAQLADQGIRLVSLYKHRR